MRTWFPPAGALAALVVLAVIAGMRPSRLAAVHGHNNVLGAVVFPHHIGLGATRDAKLVEEVERITAEEVKATGIQWAFSPCIAVARDERWGRTYESFSEDPAVVSELGAAA